MPIMAITEFFFGGGFRHCSTPVNWTHSFETWRQWIRLRVVSSWRHCLWPYKQLSMPQYCSPPANGLHKSVDVGASSVTLESLLNISVLKVLFLHIWNGSSNAAYLMGLLWLNETSDTLRKLLRLVVFFWIYSPPRAHVAVSGDILVAVSGDILGYSQHSRHEWCWRHLGVGDQGCWWTICNVGQHPLLPPTPAQSREWSGPKS